MKRSLFSLLLLCCLTGCLSETREALQSCTVATDILYPPGKPMPLGQPYQEILSCMQRAGYVMDSEGACKYRDYSSNVGDAYCYRPTGFLSGYIHDIVTTFR